MATAVEFLPGDVLLYRGKSPISRLIRRLEWLVYGIPIDLLYSHTDVVYNESDQLSAEPNGVRLNPRTKAVKGADCWAFRFYALSDADRQEFRRICDAVLAENDRYGYTKYAIRALRVVAGAAAVLWPAIAAAAVAFRLGLAAAVSPGVLSVAALVVAALLKKRVARESDCSDVVSTILARWGKISNRGVGDPIHSFPNLVAAILYSLEIHAVGYFFAVKVSGQEWEPIGGGR